MNKIGLIVVLLVASQIGSQAVVWARSEQDPRGARQKIQTRPGVAEGDPWQQLSPLQRKELSERYRRFQDLPAVEQQKIRRRYQHFQKMSPEKKQRVLERHQRLQHMAPERRQELQREWQRIKQLPEEERSQQRQELQKKYFNGNGGDRSP